MYELQCLYHEKRKKKVGEKKGTKYFLNLFDLLNFQKKIKQQNLPKTGKWKLIKIIAKIDLMKTKTKNIDIQKLIL